MSARSDRFDVQQIQGVRCSVQNMARILLAVILEFCLRFVAVGRCVCVCVFFFYFFGREFYCSISILIVISFYLHLFDFCLFICPYSI